MSKAKNRTAATAADVGPAPADAPEPKLPVALQELPVTTSPPGERENRVLATKLLAEARVLLEEYWQRDAGKNGVVQQLVTRIDAYLMQHEKSPV